MSNLEGKRLERPVSNRWLAGVAVGLGDYLGLDAVLLRVIFVVTAFIGGIGVLAYLAGWLLVPEQGEPSSILERLIGKSGS
jgi:phage shock protein C